MAAAPAADRRASSLTVGVIATYVLAVGWQPSVARAAVAGTLASLAWIAARPSDRWHFLAVGALVLLAWMPTSVLDPGFQLSFAAVAAIFVAVPRVRRRLDGLPIPSGVADAIAVALACGLATAPIVLFHFGQVPIYTVLANVVAFAAAPLVLAFGLLAAVDGPDLARRRRRARSAGGLGRCLARARRARRRGSSRAPDSGRGRPPRSRSPSSAAGSPHAARDSVGSSDAGSASSRSRRGRSPRSPSSGSPRAPRLRGSSPPVSGSRSSTSGRATRCCSRPRRHGSWSTRGRRRRTSPASCGRSGVRWLSALVLTHPQRDHVGGAADVIRRLDVGEVLEPGLAATGPESEEALATARSRHVPVRVVRAGTSFRAGRLRVRVLWPEDEGTPAEDPNQNAVVLVASYGETDVFLSADAESDVTARLPLRPVEIMKVAHHGSEDAGLAAELEDAAAADRGHLLRAEQRLRTPDGPRRSLRSTAAPGLAVYRTDEDGRVVVESDGHGLTRADRSGSVRRIADASLKPVYLITGSDRPKIETALARLRAHFAAEAIETVERARHDRGRRGRASATPGSLFGDARLVVVDRRRRRRSRPTAVARAAGRRPTSRRSPRTSRAPLPTTVLALVAEDLKSSSALWKACAKAGDVLELRGREEEAARVGRRRSSHRTGRRRPSPTRCRRSSSSSATIPHALKSEVDKLATWAAGEPFGEREVEALVASNADVPIYELTEAWAVRDAARALDVSETIFEHESEAAPRHRGAARGLARRPSRPAPRAQAARRGGRELEGGRGAAEAATRTTRGSSTGRRRASPRRSSTTRSCASPSSTARSRGRAGSRPTSRCSARSSTSRGGPERRATRGTAARDARRRLARGDELRGARLLARGGVAVERAALRSRGRSSARARGARWRRARRRRRRRPPRGASSAS